MNIVTICQLDDWIEIHLKRFLYFARRAMPHAAIYLIVPLTGAESDDAIATLQEGLDAYVTGVKFVPKPNLPGRLVDFDLLKAAALDLLPIEEGLFIDVDIDILEDLSHIPTLSQNELLWTADSVKTGTISHGLTRYGLADNVPHMQPGMFYMRRSFALEFERLFFSGAAELSSFVPGSIIWNIIVRESESAFLLPEETHVTIWAPEKLHAAKAVHFVGHQEKEWRAHWRYQGSPREIVIDPLPMEYPGIELLRTEAPAL